MIYESEGEAVLSEDAVAREAVAAECDKFLYRSAIYQIDFSYREVKTVSMTDDEATRQFGNK